MTSFNQILLIGCGNMAGAMLEGWLAGGIPPQTFTVFDPNPRDLPDGVTVLTQMPESGTFDAIMLGIKPQLVDKVAPSIEPLAGSDTIVLSILAGTRLATLARLFPRADGVVRIMPNLAVKLGKAPVGLASDGIDEAQRDALGALMAPLGTPEWIEEAQFDLFTALGGSGPAFVYRFISALAAGAGELGLPREQAVRIATAMVEGAAALAAASSEDPGALAERVASPGGTTRAGLDVLDESGAIGRLMERTLRAARDPRGRDGARVRRVILAKGSWGHVRFCLKCGP